MYLLRCAYIYLVNPRRDSALGRGANPTLPGWPFYVRLQGCVLYKGKNNGAARRCAARRRLMGRVFMYQWKDNILKEHL
jgi:hypothetical protein